MDKELKRVNFEEFTLHLGAIFDAIAEEKGAVLVEKNGLLYRLEPELEELHPDIWAGYNPQRAKQALKQSAGALAGVDRDSLLKDIHDQRGQDSHGRPA